MELLEKAIYGIDRLNNSNYKKENKNDKNLKKLSQRYDLCNKEYLSYLKSFYNVTKNYPMCENENLTILDITSGTGILALSFLNAIYNETVNYKLILNDTLFKIEDDVNIDKIKSILNQLNQINNIKIILTSYDIKEDNESSRLLSFNENVLIMDPTISVNTINTFKSPYEFFTNNTIEKLLSKSSYKIFKDGIKVKDEYLKLFEYKAFDKLEEGLNIKIIDKEQIEILKIFNKNIDKKIELITNYNNKKLSDIYFFYKNSSFQEGEEREYFYNGYVMALSSTEYRNFVKENNNILEMFNNITIEDIGNKYEELRSQL